MVIIALKDFFLVTNIWLYALLFTSVYISTTKRKHHDKITEYSIASWSSLGILIIFLLIFAIFIQMHFLDYYLRGITGYVEEVSNPNTIDRGVYISTNSSFASLVLVFFAYLAGLLISSFSAIITGIEIVYIENKTEIAPISTEICNHCFLLSTSIKKGDREGIDTNFYWLIDSMTLLINLSENKLNLTKTEAIQFFRRNLTEKIESLLELGSNKHLVDSSDGKLDLEEFFNDWGGYFKDGFNLAGAIVRMSDFVSDLDESKIGHVLKEVVYGRKSTKEHIIDIVRRSPAILENFGKTLWHIVLIIILIFIIIEIFTTGKLPSFLPSGFPKA